MTMATIINNATNNIANKGFYVVEIFKGKETRVSQYFRFAGDAERCCKHQKPEDGVVYKVVAA